MMKMTKTVQLVLAIALIASSTANAKLKLNDKPIDPEPAAAAQPAPAPAAAAAQVKDDLFAGAEKFAQGASEVTEINLDPSTIGMVSHGGQEAGVARKMNFMVIHSYKYEKPGMYSMEDFQAYSKKLTDGTWNCSIHVREKNGSTDICSRTAADHETNEMVILTAEPRELTFIHMSGKMSLSDLSRMGNGAHPGTIGPH
jgi:hypothetical protein